MYVSFSRISAYLSCPYRYFLQYVQGFKPPANHLMSFGTSLHAALRDFYSQGKIPPTLDDLFFHYFRNWSSFGFRSRELETRFFQEGLSILEEYYDRNIGDFSPALFVERKFRAEIKGIPFLGIADRIDRLRDGSLRVLDYKTYHRNEVNELQLLLYRLALEEVFGYPPQELVFYFLKEQETLKVEASQEALEEAEEALIRVSEGISRGIFTKTRGQSCLNCDFQRFCELEDLDFQEEF
ncbi:MAG: PD-(D/E)XK nuclease family protein [Caldiserica bacterium]|nr:PD-(D/E)XK nuclease family protein [Caldisericota bacterium]MDH7563166.1 PD-(D/E)XK nuclease family protein [Caldisericota bacterium]